MSNEIAKRLRDIADGLCCLQTSITTTLTNDGSFNNDEQIQIDDGGINPDSKLFAVGDYHSVTWLVNSGSVDITIGSGPTITNATSGVITNSTLNNQTLLFEIVSGDTHIIWNY